MLLSYLHHKIRTTPWMGRAALRAIPNLKCHIKIEPIGRFAIRMREHRMFWLRPPLLHEGFMLGGLLRLVRPGDVVYDIGANIGLYTRFLIQSFQAKQVCAFEPMEHNRVLLAENLSIAGCAAQVTIIPSAVGDQEGTADFQVDDLNSGTGVLDAVTHGGASQARSQYGLPPVTVRVPISRLDRLIEARSLPFPDVIKIDVEGAEAMVLAGAKNVLLSREPRLVIELHGAEVTRQALQTLWDLGYHCFGYLSLGGTSTYREVRRADLGSIQDRYSLPYAVAARSLDRLTQPIEDFTPNS